MLQASSIGVVDVVLQADSRHGAAQHSMVQRREAISVLQLPALAWMVQGSRHAAHSRTDASASHRGGRCANFGNSVVHCGRCMQAGETQTGRHCHMAATCSRAAMVCEREHQTKLRVQKRLHKGLDC